MRDTECVEFLQWALPRMGMRWSGLRRVRRQVCRRVAYRVAELGLSDTNAYRGVLAREPGEWELLARLCRVTISRFMRDRELWFGLGRVVLPALLDRQRERDQPLRCWSAGCASGEEPYSLLLVWDRLVRPGNAGRGICVVATDIDEQVLGRARRGCYGAGSLREVPASWREQCFQVRHGEYCLRREFLEAVTLLHQDVRSQSPPGPFDAILCRNLVLTYFSTYWQQRILARMRDGLVPGGVLVVGSHERLAQEAGFSPWPGLRGVYSCG